MAERKRVEVDERLIQQMMAGEVPVFMREQAQIPRETIPEKEPVALEKQEDAPEMQISEQESEKETGKAQKRKKNQLPDFTSTFLKMSEGGPRKQIYVSERVFSKMKGYFYVISDRKVDFVNYIDNILTSHMEEYKDEINRLYDKKIRRPLD